MSTDSYAIFVEVTVQPAVFAECIALTRAAATRNVAEDPGCRQIDVSVKADGDPTIYLYEVYDDLAAFDAHLKTPGFMAWREATRAMVTGMRMTRLIHNQSARRS